MLKKIVLGTLFVGLIGALVAGGVIRTQDRLARAQEIDLEAGAGRNNAAADGRGGL